MPWVLQGYLEPGIPSDFTSPRAAHRPIGKRNLTRGLEVTNQVGDLRLLKLIDQAGRHQGDIRLALGLDLAERNGETFGRRLDRNRPLVSLSDQAVENAAVAEREDRHAVIGRQRGVGVEDVLQQVTQVASLSAGQFRADGASLAEEFVTLGAGFLEEGATSGSVRSVEQAVTQIRFQAPIRC